MKKILVIHGPNLNLLGQREKSIYGKTSLKDINAQLEKQAKSLKVTIEVFQSNHEGEIVDAIQQAKSKSFKGILMNPAAYTHTSVAIRDAVAAIDLPTVEIHLSNIYAREAFRQHSLIAPVCQGQITGFGVESYYLGLEAIVKLLKS